LDLLELAFLFTTSVLCPSLRSCYCSSTFPFGLGNACALALVLVYFIGKVQSALPLLIILRLCSKVTALVLGENSAINWSGSFGSFSVICSLHGR
jgi:hypothetical protein